MTDLRYHVASLAAVFMALAIGILIGIYGVGGPSLANRQSKTITQLGRLQKKLDDIQQTQGSLEQMRSLLAEHTEFELAIIQRHIAGKLAGHNVAIVETGDQGDAIRQVQEMIERAGGHVTQVLRVLPVTTDIVPSAQVPASASPSLPTDLPETYQGKDKWYILARAISQGNADVLHKLETAGLISLRTADTQPSGSVLLMGGGSAGQNSFDSVDAPFIAACKGQGLRLAGAEHSSSASDSISGYSSANISTVDNIDEPVGLLSVIYVLSGTEGRFGTRPSATALAPAEVIGFPRSANK